MLKQKICRFSDYPKLEQEIGLSSSRVHSLGHGHRDNSNSILAKADNPI